LVVVVCFGRKLSANACKHSDNVASVVACMFPRNTYRPILIQNW